MPTKDLTDLQKKSSLKRSLNRFSQNIKEVSTHTSHAVKWWHMLAIAILFAVLLWSSKFGKESFYDIFICNHFLNFFTTVIFLVRIEARKCHIDQEELDSCAKSINFFSVERSHFPATNHQLDEYCKEKTSSIQCLKRYAQSCLTIDKVQKRYIKKFVSNFRKQLDHTCLRRSERESKFFSPFSLVILLISFYSMYITEFMSYSECLSDENLIRNATRCTESHRKRLLYIAQYVSDDLRIAAACCSLHLRHSCFNNLISDKCDRQAQRFVLDQTEGPYRSLISNVCSPYFMSGEFAHHW